jgi:hypothetical protein
MTHDEITASLREGRSHLNWFEDAEIADRLDRYQDALRYIEVNLTYREQCVKKIQEALK